jgi:hypothetical protein
MLLTFINDRTILLRVASTKCQMAQLQAARLSLMSLCTTLEIWNKHNTHVIPNKCATTSMILYKKESCMWVSNCGCQPAGQNHCQESRLFFFFSSSVNSLRQSFTRASTKEKSDELARNCIMWFSNKYFSRIENEPRWERSVYGRGMCCSSVEGIVGEPTKHVMIHGSTGGPKESLVGAQALLKFISSPT